MLTHEQKVLHFLARDKSTSGRLDNTVAERQLGVSRLSSRIYDLRSKGWTIYTNSRKVDGARHYTYRLPRSLAEEARRA